MLSFCSQLARHSSSHGAIFTILSAILLVACGGEPTSVSTVSAQQASAGLQYRVDRAVVKWMNETARAGNPPRVLAVTEPDQAAICKAFDGSGPGCAVEAFADLGSFQITVMEGANERTILHEVGHALGLDHTPSIKDVMYPYAFYNQTTEFSATDIQNIRAIYGSPVSTSTPTGF
ncbi:matrixin family metalloprotease [Oligoflexus tunisiensis]|uniref:matrixin family metalloprotease n=1 Tax=Oligoflexus tunisiensis TaxID=708132 RepID=UPI00114D2BE8|nr:matrixin family metalloprotease [Oligoflexus tunisiensis]